MKKTLLFLFIFGLLNQAFSQLIVSENNNAITLAQTLAGPGVTISNVQINCAIGSSGTFNGVGSNLGMRSGIVLTTGKVIRALGPNNLNGASFNNGALGDANLNTLTTVVTRDACVLEFDMQVLSDSVEFRYIFGSEEYPEFSHSTFNDVFGFFISGPGIVGQQNMALIPGTNRPVSINNVNPDSNNIYYRANGNGLVAPQNASPFYIQYDGFTKVLTAKRKGLQPCQTYHLKLAIADAFDYALDSGVFLEANSLTSNIVSLDTATTDVAGISTAIEGCINGKISFHLSHPVNTATTVQFQLGGTATNGLDYAQIANSITIPAGDSVATLTISPIADGIAEGNETVKVYVYSACSALPYDSTILVIADGLANALNVSGSATIYLGNQTQLNASGATSYSWLPATGLSNASIPNPIANPSITTTYVCTGMVGQCVVKDSATVTISTATFTVNAGANVVACNGAGVQLNAIVTGTPVNGNPFIFEWTPTATLSSTSVADPIVTPILATENYIVKVTSGNYSVTDTVMVTKGSLQLNISSTNETCFTAYNGSATVSASGNGTSYTYRWNNNDTTASITGLSGGTYSVTVSDNFSCSASVSIGVNGVTSGLSINAGADISECANSSVQLNTTVTGTNNSGNVIIYQWSPVTGLNNANSPNPIASPLVPTTYIVKLINGSCQVSDTVQVTLGNIQLATTVTNETCFGSANGLVAVNVVTGKQPFTYNWSNGNHTSSINGLSAGSYQVTVSDLHNCSASAFLTLTPAPRISFKQPVVTALKCFGDTDGSIAMLAEGGAGNFSYVWHSGGTNPIAQNVPANTPYHITATDINQCSTDTTVSLKSPEKLQLQANKTDITCHGLTNGEITAHITGGTSTCTIAWTNHESTPVISNLSAGNYAVTVTDANNCSTNTNVTIIEPLIISVTGASIAPACANTNTGTIDAGADDGTAPYSFNLVLNNTSLGITTDGKYNNLSAGNYVIEVTDAHNCKMGANLSLSSQAADEFNITADSTSCFGNEIKDGEIHVLPISVFNQPYSYVLDGGTPQLDGEFLNLKSGEHTLVTTNNGGCVSEHSIFVPAPEQAIVVFSLSDSSVSMGESVELSVSLSSSSLSVSSFLWSGAEGLSCTDCANPTVTFFYGENEYNVSISYNNFCTATASTKIAVENKLPEFFIPNAFSPNGDGNNDQFMVFGSGIKVAHLQVINRWGELVYDTSNQFSGWDGTYKGELQNPGVFSYVAVLTFLNGKEITKKGTFTLLK